MPSPPSATAMYGHSLPLQPEHSAWIPPSTSSSAPVPALPLPASASSSAGSPTSALPPASTNAKAKGQRNSKACLECRSQKAKCTGGDPCPRCEKKGIECVYDDFIRRRGPDRKPRIVPKRKPLKNGEPGPKVMKEKAARKAKEEAVGSGGSSALFTTSAGRRRSSVQTSPSQLAPTSPPFQHAESTTVSVVSPRRRSSLALSPHSTPTSSSSAHLQMPPSSSSNTMLPPHSSSAAYTDSASPLYADNASTSYVTKPLYSYADGTSPPYAEGASPSFSSGASPPYVDGTSPSVLHTATSSAVGCAYPAAQQQQPPQRVDTWLVATAAQAAGAWDMGYAYSSDASQSVPPFSASSSTSSYSIPAASVPTQPFYLDLSSLSTPAPPTLAHISPPLPHPAPSLPDVSWERKTYWDMLLAEQGISDRSIALRQIVNDIWIVFSRGEFAASLFHIRLFFEAISRPETRVAIPPSLIYANLAVSYAVQSRPDLPHSAVMWARAQSMRERAQTALEAAINAGAFELGVAQAAYILAYYEFLSIPTSTFTRIEAAVGLCDMVIRVMGLTRQDADQNCLLFNDDGIPLNKPARSLASESSFAAPDCTCDEWSVASIENRPVGPRFKNIPGFAQEWTLADIQKDEARRLVWSMAMKAWYLQMLGSVSTPLHVTNPPNFGLFLTSEALAFSLPPSVRTLRYRHYSLWACHDRLVLLCLAAFRLSRSLAEPERRRRADAIAAEIEAIEVCLNWNHQCEGGMHLWSAANIAFITRMILTAKMQGARAGLGSPATSPYFTRQRVDEWLDAHAHVFKLYILLGGLKESPYLTAGLLIQAQRCLDLYQLETSFPRALPVARKILKSAKIQLEFWPSGCGSCRYNELAKLCESLEAHASVNPLPPPPHPRPYPAPSVLA